METEKLSYNYPPGRGMMSKTAHDLRLEFFKTLAKNPESIVSTEITLEQVQNNIEKSLSTPLLSQ